jgi:transposase
MKKMGRPKLTLAMDAATRHSVRQHFRTCTDAALKLRLQAIMLAADGQHTYDEIAEVVGRARSLVQRWVAGFRKGGLEDLLKRTKAPGKSSELQDAAVQKQLVDGLKKGRWMTAKEISAWLSEEHGIHRNFRSMYYWLGKCGGALKVPRPVHQKKCEADADAFKEHLFDKLMALNLAPGRKVRVWVMDESRYGLRSFTRRCWGLRGVRIIKKSQQKYQWGYVYGALEVVEGRAEFRFMPSVNLGFSRDFLAQIADNDPEAEHVVIWDQAGFHHRTGDQRLPDRVHLLPLPPYSPELNPIERLWDVMKDRIANRVFATLDAIEKTLTESLRPFWEGPDQVRSLVGDGWMHLQANAM